MARLDKPRDPNRLMKTRKCITFWYRKFTLVVKRLKRKDFDCFVP